jgi:hypothetical protein
LPKGKIVPAGAVAARNPERLAPRGISENVLALEAVVKDKPRNQPIKSVDDLPNPNGPGSVPVSKEAHKMVQKEQGLDPHRRTGDRNTDLMGRK